jgi:hypothetical protein
LILRLQLGAATETDCAQVQSVKDWAANRTGPTGVEYIGLTEAEADARAEAAGLTTRVVGVDGMDLVVTMDLRLDRLNLMLFDGTVVAAQLDGEGAVPSALECPANASCSSRTLVAPGWVLVPADPPRVESFTRWVSPLSLGKTMVVGLGGGVGLGWSWWRRSELASPVIGEGEPVGAAGIAGDAEGAEVHHPVVGRTERHEIVRVGTPASGPVHEVVDVEPASPVAARHPAAAVAMLDGRPQPAGHGALAAAHGQWLGPPLQQAPHGAVAGQIIGNAGRQDGTEMQAGRGLAVRVEVQDHLRAFSRRSTLSAVEAVEPRVRNAQQCVGP